MNKFVYFESFRVWVFSILRSMESLNWTREYLIDLGYTVEVVSKYYDAIDELSFWNVTFCGRVSFDYVILDRSFTTRITGGMPASRIRARYMALIGEKRKGENPYWGCDGVLINYNWVLSAAHCFVIMGFNPNVVRLGEYNLAEEIKDQYSNFPEDFDIFKLVFHPKFDVRRRYYDLALFCLGRYVPQLSVVGSTKSEILREVNLTVFHSAFCDVFYSNLRDYHIKWPRGISEDKLLCVGDSNGMKDACQGDSGAPLTL
ncbi:Serine protease snake, partial [Armadillidium vulgare]